MKIPFTRTGSKMNKKTMERPWEKIGKLTKEHERGIEK